MGRSPYLKLFQQENENDLEIAEKAMKATNTWHIKNMNINEISGGEKQRVVIARALAQQTGIMLMDEPISQLDIHHQIELMDTIKSLVNTSDVTVVTVLHDLNIAAQYSDEIILMNDGTIFAKGLPESVITEENLMNVYGLKTSIIRHPITGKPHVLPLSSIV
jgi:iron complex transport system ATP-binding protein